MAKFDYAAKVRGLLAKADSARAMGNDEEAAAYEATAFRIMRDYKIDQEATLAQDPTSEAPTHVVMEFTVTDYMVGGYYPTILRAIATHCGVMVNIKNINRGYRVTFVGYDTDIRYAEFLWTSAYLMFSTRIAPVWSADRTPEENIFFMRNAGIERRAIADAAGWDGTKAASRSRVQRVYVREAEKRNEPVLAAGLGFNTKLYREAYAQAFVTRLNSNLRAARDAADSVGGALVFHGRTERIGAAYDELFPPAPKTDVVWVDPTKDCKACEKAKTTCNTHSYMRERAWTKRDEIAAARREYSSSARAGRTSGRIAADGVNIQRGHTQRDNAVENGQRGIGN
jgi:hypothetical protein